MRYWGMAALCAAGLALATAAPAGAAEWTLTNTKTGCNGCFTNGPPNGYAVPVGDGFTLFGDDTSHYAATTTYTTIAESTGDLSFSWDYLSHELSIWGSWQDPAGYVIDGVLTQLTVDSPPTCPVNSPECLRVQSGMVTLSVTAGQRYGFYVSDRDGGYGRGEITFQQAVPEPSTWAMLLLGFFGLGAVLRRRREPQLA